MANLDKFINTDFRIVIDYDNVKGARKEKRHLIGRSGLQNVLGMDLYIRVVNRAYRAKTEKITIRLRRGATIIFYRK